MEEDFDDGDGELDLYGDFAVKQEPEEDYEEDAYERPKPSARAEEQQHAAAAGGQSAAAPPPSAPSAADGPSRPDGGFPVSQPPPPKYPKPRSATIFVGNMTWWMSDADLERLFTGITVKSIEFGVERSSGKSRGFAVVEVRDEAAAEEAIREYHRKLVNGRPLAVCPATEDAVKSLISKGEVAGHINDFREFITPSDNPAPRGAEGHPRQRERGRERERERERERDREAAMGMMQPGPMMQMGPGFMNPGFMNPGMGMFGPMGMMGMGMGGMRRM